MTSSERPITIHIPASLRAYAKSAKAFAADDGVAEAVVVGGLIFTRVKGECYILLLQRAATEFMAGLWETPGGGAEETDPTLIHSCAREVFEEAGLHLTGATDVVGVYRFASRSGVQCIKINFVITVKEIEGDVGELKDIPVELDPNEHQAFAWVKLDDLEDGQHPITTPDQMETIKDGFKVISTS